MKHRISQLLALLLAFALLSTALTGCGSKGDAPASYDEFDAAPASEAMDIYNEAESGFVSAGSSADSATRTPTPLAEKIIYSGSISIETTAFDHAVAGVEALVREFGGFVESSDVSGSTRYAVDGTSTLVDRNAYYVVRIPCGRFQEFLKRSGDIGNVLSTNTAAENITSQFTDAEARKSSLQVQEERLLAMMKETTDIDALIQLESRLSEVRYELESIERQLINWQNRVDYSSVSLSIHEVEIYTPVVPTQRSFGQKLADAFSDGWTHLTRLGSEFLLLLAEALPLLVVLALIVVIIVLLARRSNRKRARQRAVPYAQPIAPEQTEPQDK